MSKAGIALVMIGSLLVGYSVGIHVAGRKEDARRRERIARVKYNVRRVKTQETQEEDQSISEPEPDKVVTPENSSPVKAPTMGEVMEEFENSIDFTQYAEADYEDEADVVFPGDPGYVEGMVKLKVQERERQGKRPSVREINEIREHYRKKVYPYLITEDEYNMNETNYGRYVWVYYSQDNVILDDYDNPVDDEQLEMFVGEEGLRLLPTLKDDESIFTRAQLYLADVCVVSDKTPLSEANPGLLEEKQRLIAERRKEKNEREGD